MNTNHLGARLGVSDADMVVIYDGQCVFCSAYVKLLRLKAAVGRVELLDARRDGVADVIARELGLDLNDGMLVLYQHRSYYGADAITLLSLLTGPSGLLSRALAAVFRRPRLSRMLYPALRFGRGLTLGLLGRSRIASGILR
jgi:predicted DCC family thiol-disulfide oxidoreductase YuxK